MFRSPIATMLAAAFVLVLTPVVLFGQGARQSVQEEAAKLASVLKSEAPVFDKAMACRRLAVVGDKDAVPALASMLADEKLATYARSALEAIADPAAGAALREATGHLDGELLIGVLNSIGKRRDASAVDLLSRLLAHQNRAVAAAAVRALGSVGSVKAAEVLQKALAEAGPGFRPVVAAACMICAARLQQQDCRDPAVALYDAVRKAEVPKHLTLAATHRLIVARGREGLPLLATELGSADESRFRFALQAARDLGVAACGTLTARLDREPAPRQALLILALSDIGDRAAVPGILAAAGRGEKEVRNQAIQALGRLNDPSALPVLLEAAVEQDADIAQAARAALARLESDEINAAIARMLAVESPRTLPVAVALAGQRGIASAAPALFKLAGQPDAALRLAAVKSLGSTVQLDDLPRLIALALAAKTAGERAVAAGALRAACARLPRDACVEKLTAATAGASTEASVSLLEQLAAVGGPKALKEVVAAAGSGDDALQDAATRLLGGWMTADAAPELLILAKTLTDGKYRLRALRGYVRIARQLNMSPEERLQVCRNTLAIAERSEEKKLALEVLGRVGSAPALALAVSLLADSDLQSPACSAIVAMSDAAASTAPEETEKALAQVLRLSANPALKRQAEVKIAGARQIAQQRREESLFVPLFDGRTLAGWEGDPTIFRVEAGAIVGGSLKKAIGRGNDFLCTKKKYRDFELRLQFKLLGENANGGVNVRSQRNPEDGVAAGYQADLGPGYWGCLYDEARRNRILADATPKPTIRQDDWNDYRIRCEGRRIRLWVNGTETVDYVEQDANISPSGVIALQVQANRPTEARYRNVRIRELPATPSAQRRE
jgi:HEAT repeat protein